MSEAELDNIELPALEPKDTTEGSKDLVPDTQRLADSNKVSLRVNNEMAGEHEGTNYAEGHRFAGMHLASIYKPSIGSSVSDDAIEAEGSGIDIVHVVGALPSQHELLSLSKIASVIGDTSEKREFLFHVATESLLNEDVELTRMNVDAEAHRLISALKHFQHSDAEVSRRAIIFIAYDIGAIILQRAISVASLEHMGERGIFTDTTRVVSCGCFQRAEDDKKMGVRMFKFLESSNHLQQAWSKYLTLPAAQNLAYVSQEARTSFLRSRIALRSRLISLYAGAAGGQIHETFDYFTATLGIATELAMEEVFTLRLGSTFPQLAENLLSTVPGLALDPWRVALESTLMSMAPQSTQMLSTAHLRDHPILSSDTYRNWCSGNGTQILFINGPDPLANMEAAEQVGLDWVRRQPSTARNVFSFKFDARNPLRNSTSSLINAALLHYFSQGCSDSFSQDTFVKILTDQLKLQNAWLDEDVVNLAYIERIFVSEHTPSLLLGLDTCDADDRESLWALLGKHAGQSEESAKFVVTTNEPGTTTWFTVFQRELRIWPEISLLEFTMDTDGDRKPVNQCKNDVDWYHSAWIARLCPKGMGRSELQETLQRIRSMDCGVLDEILKLLETYSRWPTTLSSSNLALFCSLVQKVSPNSTPGSILNSILQSIPDQDWLQWLLSWIQFAQRPLTLLELSMLLSYCTKTPTGSLCLLDDEDIQISINEIDCQLRGFLDINEGNVLISGSMLGILDESQPGFWKMVGENAPGRTAHFLLDFLGSPEIQQRLKRLYRQYEIRLERSQEVLTPPLVPNGRDAIFYAVQALPYHLSRITVADEVRESMCDPKGPYMAWSQVYWAMLNPFSRPVKGPLPSAWSTWETSKESGPFNLVRMRLTKGDREERISDKLMESLLAAVKANNEDLSITFAEQVLIDFKADGQSISGACHEDQSHQIIWPKSIIWRAIWLRMNRLLEFLLQNGMQTDDSSSVYTSSPLYLATLVDNSEAISLLIKWGADFRVSGRAGGKPLQAASARGHSDVVKVLLKKDMTMLESFDPNRPLYAAAAYGCWKVVKYLLENKADPERKRESSVPNGADHDPEEDWTPLTAAVSQGFSKTARLLLEYGAGPNQEEPWQNRVPLYFAAVECGSVELVRLLLEYKADPDHARLVPPILTAIIEGAQLPDETEINMLKVLLNHHKPVSVDKVDTNGQTALMAAVKREDLTAIQFLLENGADVDAVDSKNQNSLFWAVLERKALAVKALLNHSVKPRLELINSSGESLLQAALGHDGILRILVEAGADLSYANEQQQTVLNVAVVQGNREAVSYLLTLGPERKVDIHHVDNSGYTPILDATGYKPDTEIVQILMKHGARLSDVNLSGHCPLHFAASEARPDMLGVLLNYHNQEDLERRNNHGDTPLLSIEEMANGAILDCIQLLVRAGADINATDKSGLTILMKAAASRPEAGDVYDYILSRPDVNIKSVTNAGVTALHVASCFGAAALVTKLLEHGADPNSRAFTMRSTPLIAACRPSWAIKYDTDDFAVVLQMMDRIVRDLVSRGAAVQAMLGISLFSPLAAASMYASVGTINYLLEKSASVRKADPLGRLAIHFAAANGIRNFEAVALAHDGDIMVNDRFGKNVLHWASEFGHVKAVRAILERLLPKKVEDYINAGDADGWTPLAWACRPTTTDVGSYWIFPEQPNYSATIQCLLDHGADKSIPFQMRQDEESVEESTPLTMAMRCGHNDDVLSLLKVEGTKSTGDGTASQVEAGTALLVERKYREKHATCDFCFSQIWGIMWSCKSCQGGQYVLCKKCYRTGHIEHQSTVNDHREGQKHDFEILETDKEEFEDPSSTVPSVKAASVVSSGPGTVHEDQEAEERGRQEDEELTPGLDDWEYEVDDIGELVIPELNEFGQLDDII